MSSHTTAEDFNAQLLAKIPSEWRLTSPVKNDIDVVRNSGILSPSELSILNNDTTGLRDLLAVGKVTAVEVALAFSKATAIAHQATHCLFDFFPDEAQERARWLDEQLKRTGKPVGPLHGAPISMKDLVALKGHDNTGGFLHFVGKNKAEEDCLLVKILKKAGAVFLCKTSQPQGALSIENESFAGVTVNPYNDNLTSGGSTGGEGALIALNASVLGVGSDMAGSLRAPGAACGVYAFRPTAARLPDWGGNSPALSGTGLIAGAAGPMARSVRDLNLFMQVILDDEPWRLDPLMVGMLWNRESVQWKGSNMRPRIGVMRDDGNVKPHPPMVRAMEHTLCKLREAGFDLVEVQPFRSKEGWELLVDQLRETCDQGGEECLPLTEWLLSHSSTEMTMAESLELGSKRDQFRADYYAHFEKLDIDVMLTPGSFSCARPHRTSTYPHYWSMYNLVDVPAAVFPTGLYVNPSVDVKEDRSDYLYEEDQKLHTAYDPWETRGAPLCLQLVGPRWHDEKLMQALELVASVTHP